TGSPRTAASTQKVYMHACMLSMLFTLLPGILTGASSRRSIGLRSPVLDSGEQWQVPRCWRHRRSRPGEARSRPCLHTCIRLIEYATSAHLGVVKCVLIGQYRGDARVLGLENPGPLQLRTGGKGLAQGSHEYRPSVPVPLIGKPAGIQAEELNHPRIELRLDRRHRHIAAISAYICGVERRRAVEEVPPAP